MTNRFLKKLCLFILFSFLPSCVVYLNYRAQQDPDFHVPVGLKNKYQLNCAEMDGDFFSEYYLKVRIINPTTETQTYTLSDFKARVDGKIIDADKWAENLVDPSAGTADGNGVGPYTVEKDAVVKLPARREMNAKIYFQGIKQQTFQFFIQKASQPVEFSGICLWAPRKKN